MSKFFRDVYETFDNISILADSSNTSMQMECYGLSMQRFYFNG